MSHADGGRAATTELSDPRRASGRRPRGGRAMSELSTPFRERAANALGDRFLQQALTIATTKFIDLRREAFEAFPEGEALRDRAREIKEATLQRLDHYLDQLIDNVERFRWREHFADTA